MRPRLKFGTRWYKWPFRVQTLLIHQIDSSSPVTFPDLSSYVGPISTRVSTKAPNFRQLSEKRLIGCQMMNFRTHVLFWTLNIKKSLIDKKTPSTEKSKALISSIERFGNRGFLRSVMSIAGFSARISSIPASFRSCVSSDSTNTRTMGPTHGNRCRFDDYNIKGRNPKSLPTNLRQASSSMSIVESELYMRWSASKFSNSCTGVLCMRDVSVYKAKQRVHEYPDSVIWQAGYWCSWISRAGAADWYFKIDRSSIKLNVKALITILHA